MHRYLTLSLIMLSNAVFGQINFQFIPEIHGRTIEGLFNCRILNLAERQTSSVVITVTEKSKGLVCKIQTSPFTITSGNNAIPAFAVKNARIQFSNSEFGVMASQTGSFFQGDYEYCFVLSRQAVNDFNATISQQCYDYGLTPFTELLLIEPYNLDSVCESRPMLSWQPSIPGIPGTNYQVLLTEIKGNQTAVEAIRYNLPLFNQNTSTSLLNYPHTAKELQLGRKYGWQVTAHRNGTVLNRSEVWEFTVACPDTLARAEKDEGYRDVDDLSRGNYYVANRLLRFSVFNSYGKQELIYDIRCLTDPQKKIRKLKKITLSTGRNKIKMDLRGNNSFIDGYYYVIRISLPNGIEKSLRFVYKESL